MKSEEELSNDPFKIVEKYKQFLFIDIWHRSGNEWS